MQIQCEMNTKCMSIWILCREYLELLKLKHKTVAIEIRSLKPTFHEVTSCWCLKCVCRKWPDRLIYMNWQHHFNIVSCKQCEWMECGETVRFWYRKCIEWVISLCHEISVLLKQEISWGTKTFKRAIVWKNSGTTLSWHLW